MSFFPPVFFQGFASKRAQLLGIFSETARPDLFVIETVQDLRGYSVLLFVGKSFDTAESLLE